MTVLTRRKDRVHELFDSFCRYKKKDLGSWVYKNMRLVPRKKEQKQLWSDKDIIDKPSIKLYYIYDARDVPGEVGRSFIACR